MKKIYYLSTCDTCRQIIKTLPNVDQFDLQDIKTTPITEAQLEQLRDMTGSYERLFSKRAIKYKEMKLKHRMLSEDDYRDLLLEEYTFLKRPVIVVEDRIFAGSEKKTLEQLKQLSVLASEGQEGEGHK